MKMKPDSQLFISELYQRYKSGLTRYLTAKFSDTGEAEDIAQDAFHNLSRIDNPENLENPKAYLFQTATNLALNRIRKNHRHRDYLMQVESSDAHPTQSDLSPERNLAGQEGLSHILQSLDELPDKCKAAFIMSRAQNKNYQEIAEELGVSVSAVEKYLMRALKHICSQHNLL